MKSIENMGRRLSAGIIFLVLAQTLPAATVWQNETDLPAEADFVQLTSPASFTGSANVLSSAIFGRIFESVLTPAAGAHPSVTAELGYGPSGSDPRTSAVWMFVPAFFNSQVGNDDEYVGSFVAPLINGTYSYTYRFSIDGSTWTAADLDGAGSNSALFFDPSNLGQFTITDGISIPETTTSELLALGVFAWVARRHLNHKRSEAHSTPGCPGNPQTTRPSESLHLSLRSKTLTRP